MLPRREAVEEHHVAPFYGRAVLAFVVDSWQRFHVEILLVNILRNEFVYLSDHAAVEIVEAQQSFLLFFVFV